ncbi:MAG: ubiquinol oxidase subunit II [Chlamydiae bacterium]|nr:ubiquinol oxidase subunit II [Chlamydiota bacterium]
MSTKQKFLILLGIFAVVGIASFAFLFTHEISVLSPKGMVGEKERDLLVLATVLMLIVVIPVFFLTFWFAWKYREGNAKSKYMPNWEHSTLAESIWWTVPLIIIAILAAVNWIACHRLDPFKPIVGEREPLKIQVVALQWKWLFIYPDQNIASLNFVQFPEKTPLAFEITADAPMNSFWIPDLGGQVYAMPGMRAKLHLIANQEGEFEGSSANFSGKGFASMRFVAKSTSQEEFQNWVRSVQNGSKSLNLEEYTHLVEPSEYNPATFYRLAVPDLFDRISMQYMEHKP